MTTECKNNRQDWTCTSTPTIMSRLLHYLSYLPKSFFYKIFYLRLDSNQDLAQI